MEESNFRMKGGKKKQVKCKKTESVIKISYTKTEFGGPIQIQRTHVWEITYPLY